MVKYYITVKIIDRLLFNSFNGSVELSIKVDGSLEKDLFRNSREN